MYKTFAGKAMIPIVLVVAGLTIISCIILYSVIKTRMINDAIRHETALADTIVKATRYAMLTSDRVTLGNIITNISEQDAVAHVRIFNKKGLIMFSSHPDDVGRFLDKKAAGCVACHAGPVAATRMGRMEQARRFVNERGNHVLAITAPIYNAPDCSSASCHFHPSEQKILGTLDIGVSEESLRKTLINMRNGMIVYCVIVLCFTLGGVFAMLRLNVLQPINELVDYIRSVRNGTLDCEPPRSEDEVGEIARSFHSMAVRLNKASKEQGAEEGRKSVSEQSHQIQNQEKEVREVEQA